MLEDMVTVVTYSNRYFPDMVGYLSRAIKLEGFPITGCGGFVVGGGSVYR